jgi:hypothetical protein
VRQRSWAESVRGLDLFKLEAPRDDRGSAAAEVVQLIRLDFRTTGFQPVGELTWAIQRPVIRIPGMILLRRWPVCTDAEPRSAVDNAV